MLLVVEGERESGEVEVRMVVPPGEKENFSELTRSVDHNFCF